MRSFLGRSASSFRWSPFLGLLCLGVLAAGLLAWSNTVEVDVDGEVTSVRTYVDTVGDVLDRLDVDVDHGDEVSPALDAPVESGMLIEVARASTVDVRVDGLILSRVVAPVETVADVLAEADLAELPDDGARVTPALGSSVGDGDVIEVWTPQDVRIAVDGETLTVETLIQDVESLLEAEGIELGDDDRINVALEAPLVFVDDVVIERVEYVDEVDEVVLEHDEVRRETDDLDQGNTRVDVEGEDGLRHDTWQVKLVDGDEVDRELVDEEIVREPTDRVVLVGTRTPPPPPPPPPSSSSSSGSRSAPSGAPAADDPVWDRLAQCESNGNWSNISGNGLYYGGLQFHPDTWRSVGGSGMPHQASRAEQIYRAQILQARSGWGQWPACSQRLGLR
ncbi:MAG: resuscitation-promoting factor [Nitriliruptor sp.]|nr:MAG: resuscitation-promoting factor [Nitriliruptor sp.]